MRRIRAVGAAALVGVLVGATGGGAGAATTGVGTGVASSSVLQVQLGTNGALLNVRVLGDDSRSTIDSKVSQPSAFTRLAPLDISSTVVPGLALSVPGAEAKSPGGQQSLETQAVNLNSPASTGSLNPAALTAVVDAAGARSGLNSVVSNLKLVGGLLDVPSITNGLATSSTAPLTSSTRGLKVDKIAVLDLGALLDGLGLSLADLPLATVSQLLTTLGLPVAGLPQGASLQGTVDTLNQAINLVKAQLANVGTTVDSTLNNTLGGLVGSLPGGLGSTIQVPTVGSAVDTLNGTLTQLQGQLTTLLNGALSALDGAALLTANGIDVGLTTKAAETVANSVAEVTAKIGSLQVGNVSLPGVDLGATVTQVTNLVNTVTGQLNSVLGAIDPGLANLVQVKVLEQTKGVSTSGGYIRSAAGITALRASINVPTNLTGIVGNITSLVGVGDLLGQLGAASVRATALDTGMLNLENVLGGVQALAGGATIKVGELVAGADYITGAQVTTPPGGDLPRTGGDGALWAVLGVLTLALAVAMIRWLRAPLSSN